MINVNGSVCGILLKFAVTSTACVDPLTGGSLVAVAMKVPEEDPARTVTEVGTVSAGLFAESATLEPPAGAGSERATVQVDVAPA